MLRASPSVRRGAPDAPARAPEATISWHHPSSGRVDTRREVEHGEEALQCVHIARGEADEPLAERPRRLELTTTASPKNVSMLIAASRSASSAAPTSVCKCPSPRRTVKTSSSMRRTKVPAEPVARRGVVEGEERVYAPLGIEVDPGSRRAERARAPAGERVDRLLELLPVSGQLVDRRRCGRRELPLLEDARASRSAQPRGQDVGADAR